MITLNDLVINTIKYMRFVNMALFLAIKCEQSLEAVLWNSKN